MVRLFHCVNLYKRINIIARKFKNFYEFVQSVQVVGNPTEIRDNKNKCQFGIKSSKYLMINF